MPPFSANESSDNFTIFFIARSAFMKNFVGRLQIEAFWEISLLNKDFLKKFTFFILKIS